MKLSSNSTRLKRPWKKMRGTSTTGAFTCNNRSIICIACSRSSETCSIWTKASCLRFSWMKTIGWRRLGLLSMTRKFSPLSAPSMRIRVVERAALLARSHQDQPRWLLLRIATREAMATTTTLSRQTSTIVICQSRLISANSFHRRSSTSRQWRLKIPKSYTLSISVINFNTWRTQLWLVS